MFTKVLIANRGEIACRIIRAARTLGISTVAIASDADARALHVEMADTAVSIGPSPADQSYLVIDKIIAAATEAGADCVHPGYGFLSENAGFAERCQEAGLKFIGPQPDAMRRLGQKDAAKAIAVAAGVPVVPGYYGDQCDKKRLLAEAEKLGFPLMVKAVAGGGGRGMRQVHRGDQLSEAIDSAAREAKSAFGDDRLMLERLIQSPRHIEVQVFGDSHGNVVHLFERDCSLQRRHQKVIEEAPAPLIGEGLRARMTTAAVSLAAAVGYEGAGTVEFLIEDNFTSDDAEFYFIEMNTRLQVEHPVTELVTGTDLVAWQFLVAAGEPLPLAQGEIQLRGHAIEARIYAEDPANEFRPSVGQLKFLHIAEPDGVRIDTGVRQGDEISAFYDPMIAKLIAYGADRAEALARMQQALSQSVVLGPQTNLSFLKTLAGDVDVGAGRVNTDLIASKIDQLTAIELDTEALASGVVALLGSESEQGRRTRSQPGAGTATAWQHGDAFQLGPPRKLAYTVLVDDEPNVFELTWTGTEIIVNKHGDAGWQVHVPIGEPKVPLVRGKRSIQLWVSSRQLILSLPDHSDAASDEVADHGRVVAPLSGRVSQIFVAAGDIVQAGARVAVIEAMKMEHVLHAPHDGVVTAIHVGDGAQVSEGDVLLELDDEAAT